MHNIQILYKVEKNLFKHNLFIHAHIHTYCTFRVHTYYVNVNLNIIYTCDLYR